MDVQTVQQTARTLRPRESRKGLPMTCKRPYPHTERRGFVRVPFDAEVLCKLPRRSAFALQARNVSRVGFCLSSTETIEVGQFVQAEFPELFHDGAPVCLEGQVIYCVPNETGFAVGAVLRNGDSYSIAALSEVFYAAVADQPAARAAGFSPLLQE